MRCTDQLAGDHQVILQALEVLREMTDHIELKQSVNRDDIRTVLDFFREFAHRCLDRKEESILLPALTRAGLQLQDGQLDVILNEHKEAHELIVRVEDALNRSSDWEFVHLSRRYIQRITNLIFDEDHFLFEAAGKVLQPEDDSRITAQFDAIGRELGDGARLRFDRIIHKLDSKYSFPQCI